MWKIIGVVMTISDGDLDSIDAAETLAMQGKLNAYTFTSQDECRNAAGGILARSVTERDHPLVLQVLGRNVLENSGQPNATMVLIDCVEVSLAESQALKEH